MTYRSEAHRQSIAGVVSQRASACAPRAERRRSRAGGQRSLTAACELPAPHPPLPLPLPLLRPWQVFTCEQLLGYLRSFTAVKEASGPSEAKAVEAPQGMKAMKKKEGLEEEMFTGVPKKAAAVQAKGKVRRRPRHRVGVVRSGGRALLGAHV